MSDEEAVKAAEAAAAAKAVEDKAAAEKLAADKANLDDPAKIIATLNSENAQRRLEAKSLQEKLDKIEADQKAAKEKAALENGEVTTLYETLKAEHEAAKALLDGQTAALQKILDAELAQIPENMRAVVPAGDVASQLAWIATAKEAKLFTTTGGPGVRPSGEPELTSLEAQLAEAEKNGNIMAVVSLKRQLHEKQRSN